MPGCQVRGAAVHLAQLRHRHHRCYSNHCQLQQQQQQKQQLRHIALMDCVVAQAPAWLEGAASAAAPAAAALLL
jgi:hypothetical protein